MATWADIQRGIFAGESGGDYGALFNYQNRPDGRFSNVDLTQMTVDQALQFADPSGPYAQYVKGQVGRVATPMGAYQVVGSTLRSAKEGLGLTGNERMTPELQDRIGQWIYQAQGTGAWEGYKGPRVSTKGVSAMDGNNMNDQAMGALNAMQEQNKSDKYKDIAGNLAVAFNSMRLNPDPNIASTIKDIRDARSEKQAKSKTLAYLEKIGRGDLVTAIEAGLSPKAAISQMFTEAAELRGFERQKELATFTAGLTKEKDTALIRQALAAGLKQGTPEFQRYILSGGDIYSQETSLLANLPKPESGMRYEFDRDESGRVTNYRLVPIEGGSAATEAQQLAEAEKQRQQDQLQKDYSFFGAGERVISAIENEPTLIPKTGIVAGMIADTPFGQAQKNVAEDLAIMESQMQFETLADLKRASPTGASGLGQLTDAERRALGKIEQNFNSLQGEDAIKRTIRSASLMRTYMKNGIKDIETGQYRNATPQELEAMVQGINPFGPQSGAILEGLPSGIFPIQSTTEKPAQSSGQALSDDDLLKKYGG